MPVRVRLLYQTIRVDGAVFAAGTVLTVARQYLVNRESETVYALMDEFGTWVLPCVDRDDIEILDAT